CFGEISCSTYKRFGAAGLISTGAGRDLDQVEALNFPCFTSGTICAHGYCHLPSLGVPVQVGGLTIRPGDLLHGDGNGITVIPLEIASEVAHACAEALAGEAVIMNYLKSDRVDPKGWVAAHNDCKGMFDALAKRLRK